MVRARSLTDDAARQHGNPGQHGDCETAAIEGNAETAGRRALAVLMHEPAMRGVAAWRLVVQTRRARAASLALALRRSLEAAAVP